MHHIKSAASRTKVPTPHGKRAEAEGQTVSRPHGRKDRLLLLAVRRKVRCTVSTTNEIALVGRVSYGSGPAGYGLFFLGSDGVMQPVLLPQQELPGGQGRNDAATDQFLAPSINDEGAIAFLTRHQGTSHYSAYRWQHGTITPILVTGSSALAGSEKITNVSSVFLNSRNSNVLVTATTNRTGSSRHGLYEIRSGELSKVAVPGQAMPGGGTLRTIQYAYRDGEDSLPILAVSAANAAGWHAFIGTLEDGSTAAYQIQASGRLSLIMKSETSVRIGRIAAATRSVTFVAGSRPFINRHGQVALAVRMQDGPDMIVLLSPSS